MSQDSFANTKLVNKMVEGETCYFRPSGFAHVREGEGIRLYVETDYRVWKSPDSHNTIPIKLVGIEIHVPEQYRSMIEREISLGGGLPFDSSAESLPVEFV